MDNSDSMDVNGLKSKLKNMLGDDVEIIRSNELYCIGINIIDDVLECVLVSLNNTLKMATESVNVKAFPSGEDAFYKMLENNILDEMVGNIMTENELLSHTVIEQDCIISENIGTDAIVKRCYNTVSETNKNILMDNDVITITKVPSVKEETLVWIITRTKNLSMGYTVKDSIVNTKTDVEIIYNETFKFLKWLVTKKGKVVDKKTYVEKFKGNIHKWGHTRLWGKYYKFYTNYEQEHNITLEEYVWVD